MTVTDRYEASTRKSFVRISPFVNGTVCSIPIMPNLCFDKSVTLSISLMLPRRRTPSDASRKDAIALSPADMIAKRFDGGAPLRGKWKIYVQRVYEVVPCFEAISTSYGWSS